MRLKTTIVSIAVSLSITIAALAYQPGAFDMVIQAGEDFSLVYTESNAGVPVNQTGTTYVAQCSPTPGAAPFANFSSSLANPTTVQVRLSNAQTTKLAGKSGVWWIKRTDAAGLVSYRLAGKCTVVLR